MQILLQREGGSSCCQWPEWYNNLSKVAVHWWWKHRANRYLTSFDDSYYLMFFHEDAFNVQVHHLREQVVEERELIGARTENVFLFNLQNGEDGRQEWVRCYDETHRYLRGASFWQKFSWPFPPFLFRKELIFSKFQNSSSPIRMPKITDFINWGGPLLNSSLGNMLLLVRILGFKASKPPSCSMLIIGGSVQISLFGRQCRLQRKYEAMSDSRRIWKYSPLRGHRQISFSLRWYCYLWHKVKLI